MENRLIQFLRSYGPTAASNKLYDEFVVAEAGKTGCAPLRIEQPLIGELATMLRSDAPRSVILTGTAGDGKTYTARGIVEALDDSGAIWSNTRKVFEVRANAGQERPIRFVKDLSELNQDKKNEIFPDLRASLLGEPGSGIFVVCVNDGHLLKFFRDQGPDDGGLHARVAGMLRNDERDDPDGNFLLVNMSRSSNENFVDQIIDGIVRHPDWKGCEGCPAKDSADAPCPIRANRDILANADAASMRARLKDMIRMAAADRRHLSIRQLILLAVNVLLGDGKNPSKPLLTCRTARKRAGERGYADTNPYSNAFGDNLPDGQRHRYEAFRVLGEFGIGLETNNHFDDSLIEGRDALPDDPLYGSEVFKPHRKGYGAGDDAQGFRRAILNQRRRLFFSMDPEPADTPEQRSPWNLSMFKHGSAYAALARGAADGRVPEKIADQVVCGLNRIMTGEMTTTSDRLWLTEPSGVYLGREISLLAAQAGPQPDGIAVVSFPRVRQDGKAPVLRFAPARHDGPVADLDLRPTLFECLMRIAHGALPASFSSECHQDIEQFQLKAVAVLKGLPDGDAWTPREVFMPDSRGELESRPIAALENEEEW